jgi:hypothetical protein
MSGSELAGIEFINENSGGPGARLRNCQRPKTIQEVASFCNMFAPDALTLRKRGPASAMSSNPRIGDICETT